jgi:hypothetical protein
MDAGASNPDGQSFVDQRSPRRRHAMPNPDQRRRALTLPDVAAALQTDVRTVRKLIRMQREEDTAAAVAGRSPRTVGLRAKQLSKRLTRVSEAALYEFMQL